jgi:hypothetical protein
LVDLTCIVPQQFAPGRTGTASAGFDRLAAFSGFGFKRCPAAADGEADTEGEGESAMKGLVVFLIVGGMIALTVLVLSSAMGGPAQHSQRAADVTGPLAVGAVSKAKQTIQVWREARGSISAQDRRELLLTVLQPGETFKVLNHIPGDHLWLEVECRNDPEQRGWMRSLAHEPIRATRVN